MNEEKELLINQLKALAETMKTAVENEAKLHMDAWVSNYVKGGPPCETAACVCGHHSIYGDLAHFPYAQSVREEELWLVDRASNISDDLNRADVGVFGKENLAPSIWACDKSGRLRYAESSGLFTNDELDTHRHLNTTSTPQDAYDYLILCIEKVENYA